MLVGTNRSSALSWIPTTHACILPRKVEVSKSIYTRGFRDREAAATEDWVSGCTMRPGGYGDLDGNILLRQMPNARTLSKVAALHGTMDVSTLQRL